MKAFSSTELQRMKATQEAAMMDACVLMRYSETLDDINYPMPTWTDEVMVQCGLDQRGGSEQRGSNRVVVRWDARLRLPLNTVLDLRDRVRMVMRFGQPCAETVYEVAAPPEIGPSGMVVALNKVEPSI